VALFGESAGRVVVAVTPEAAAHVEAACVAARVPTARLGASGGHRLVLGVGREERVVDVALAAMSAAWTRTFAEALGGTMTPWVPLDVADDKPREECGVFGVYRPSHGDGDPDLDLATLCQLGLFALQHRGQESCGICVTDGSDVRLEKGMGLVAQVFTDERL